MSELPTIESGKIWENRSIKEVLFAIQKGRKAEYAVARICSDDGEIDGEFLINRSNTIQGARLLEPDIGGWEALKKLLTVEHGSYSLLDVSGCPEEASYLEEGLKVRINYLVNNLPNLPDNPEENNNNPSMARIRAYVPSELPEDQDRDRKTSVSGMRRPADLSESTDEKPPTKQDRPNLLLIGGLVLVVIVILAVAIIFMMPH